ncbi:MAG: hypothetical protein ACRYG5_18560 [Janthinobacterium lividum]
MILNVLEILQRNPVLMRKARFLNLVFDLGVGPQPYRVVIDRGAVHIAPRNAASAGANADAIPATFAIDAAASVWQEFAGPERKPQYHDLIAMIESGHATITGDLLPFFRNLFFIKGIMAAAFRGDASW